MDYMKEYISEQIKGIHEYAPIFTMFVICLRDEGISYQRFRTKIIKNSSDQINLPFRTRGQFT